MPGSDRMSWTFRTAFLLRRCESPEKKVRYSPKTSSVVTIGESILSEVMARARLWAASLGSVKAIRGYWGQSPFEGERLVCHIL